MAVSMTADQFHLKLDQLRHRLEQLRHRMDTEATREGETTTELDQVDRGDIEATREGETRPKLDQVDRGDIKVTREGETIPELDQVDRGDIEPDGNMIKDEPAGLDGDEIEDVPVCRVYMDFGTVSPSQE